MCRCYCVRNIYVYTYIILLSKYFLVSNKINICVYIIMLIGVYVEYNNRHIMLKIKHNW